MTRRKEYTTATARRRADPIVWVIDGHEIRVRADIEFDDLEEMLEIAKDTGDLAGEEADVLQAVKSKTAKLREAVASYVEPEDLAEFDVIRDVLDISTMLDMIQDVVGEVAGTVPTVPPSSSDGSSPPGPSSTAGAQRTGSIPLPSPPIGS